MLCLLLRYTETLSIILIQIVTAESESNNVQTITSANSCPLWFVYNNNSDGKGCSHCECKENFGDVVICDEKL